MNKTVRNAVRRSRINSEYFCSNKENPTKDKKGQKMSSPDTRGDVTLPTETRREP